MAATSSSSSPATTSNKEDELASLGDLEGLEHDEIQLLRKLKPFDRAIIDISYIFISSQAFRKIMELSVETLLAAKFAIKDGTEPASTPLFSIEMKSLQLLEVHLSNLPLPPNVFLLFKMPNLKILKIASNDYSYCRPCDFKLIRTLVGGSCCFHLTHLRVANVEITGSANPPAARDTTFCERQRNSMNSSGKDVHLESYTLFKLLPHLRELCLPSNAYIHPSTLLLIGEGHLLRRLHRLKLGSASPRLVFDMVTRRKKCLLQ